MESYTTTTCGTCGGRKPCIDVPAEIAGGSSYPGDNADMASAEYDGPRYVCDDCSHGEPDLEQEREACARRAFDLEIRMDREMDR